MEIQTILIKHSTSIQGSISGKIWLAVMLKNYTSCVQVETLTIHGLNTSLTQSENFSVVD